MYAIKQQTNLTLANKVGDHSMSVKVSICKKSSYFVYGEDNKPDLLQMRVKGPYNLIILLDYAILVNYDWAVYN